MKRAHYVNDHCMNKERIERIKSLYIHTVITHIVCTFHTSNLPITRSACNRQNKLFGDLKTDIQSEERTLQTGTRLTAGAPAEQQMGEYLVAYNGRAGKNPSQCLF